MAYIGNPPISGNFQVCDAISVVNGQAAYTMQVSSANVTPESANHMLVSLNGVLQKPNSSFTISGSTITFASNLATGDVIDFILLLGNVNDIGTPSDATVTDAKTNFVSTSSAAGLQIKGDGTTDGTLQLNCRVNSHGIGLRSPSHSSGQSYTIVYPTSNITAGKFLKVDSVSGSGSTGIGQLSFADAGGGYTHLQTTNVTSGTSDVQFTSNIDSNHNAYLFILSDVHPATDGTPLRMFVSTDGGSSYISTNYGFGHSGRTAGASELQHSGTNDGHFDLSSQNVGGANDESISVQVYLHKPSGTAGHKLISGTSTVVDNNNTVSSTVFGGMNYSTEAPITAVKFAFGSGNIDRGNFTLLGLKNS